MIPLGQYYQKVYICLHALLRSIYNIILKTHIYPITLLYMGLYIFNILHYVEAEKSYHLDNKTKIQHWLVFMFDTLLPVLLYL